MAQLVEQLIRNQQVAGSSPASSSQEDIGTISGVFFCFIGNLRRISIKQKALRVDRTAAEHPVLQDSIFIHDNRIFVRRAFYCFIIALLDSLRRSDYNNGKQNRLQSRQKEVFQWHLFLIVWVTS